MVIQNYEAQYRTAYDEKLYTAYDGNGITTMRLEASFY